MQFYLSLICAVHRQGVKDPSATLGMTIREDGLSHISFHSFTQKAAPSGQIYPPPSARPFFKGLYNGHVKTLTLRKVSSPISSFRAKTKTGNPVFHTTRNHGISCSKALTQVTSH